MIETPTATFGGKATPQDFRRWSLLAWVPYFTGTEVAVHVDLELKSGAAETVTGWLYSGATSPGDTREALRFADRSLPLALDTPSEYLSIPGDVQYVLRLEGAGSEIIGDFMVMSKDRTVLNLFLPLIAIAISVAALLVSILT